MFKKYFGVENDFENFLLAYADNLEKASAKFYEFISNFNVAGIEKWVKEIKEIEHNSDDVTHETMNWLEGTFIVNYDREDIHELVSDLDDIIDFMDAAATRISLYNVTEMIPEVVMLAQKLQLACQETAKAVRAVSGPKLNRSVLEICKNIKTFESEGDELYHGILAMLFKGGKDPLYVIKFKEIVEEMERSLDKCNQAAMDVESLIFKYS
jgi:hypothetical protein